MIIVCEPQCYRFEHADVNAALLAALRYAFPEDKILFIGEREHIQYIKGLTDLHSISAIDFLVIDIPPRNSSSLKRLPAEFKICKEVFELATLNNTDKVVFSSITSSGLIAIKVLNSKYKQIKKIVIPHSNLNRIIGRPSLRPIELPFWFKIHFFWGYYDTIKYLMLSPSIETQLKILFPNMKNKLISIDLPYFFRKPPIFPQWENKIIRFGSFGVGSRNKGTDVFIKLAKEVNAVKSDYNPEFILIGHIPDKSLKSLGLGDIKLASSDLPLSSEEFEKYAQNVDYAVFCYKQTLYRLTTSAALFDAFSYAKPIIALKTPLFEYYFETMGDIGYLCDNFEEMKAVIIELIKNPPTERYLKQRDNILNGRGKIDLKAIADKLSNTFSLF